MTAPSSPTGKAGTDFTLAQIAGHLDREFRGDGDITVNAVATLTGAGPRELSFLANPAYRRYLDACRAGIVIMSESDAGNYPGAAVLTPEPYADYARAAQLFQPDQSFDPGVHPTAVIGPDVKMEPGCGVGPHVVIGAGSTIGSGAWIGAGSVLASGCQVGAQSRLVARVTLGRNVVIGERVLIHPGAVIGADGFGIAMTDGHWLKVPQLGTVRVGNDCEIGANTTIDRGAIEDTVLGNDVRLDNQIQIGHNVVIGDHTAIAGCAAVAGSATIGRYCLIGGGAGVVGHIQIADKVTVTAMTLVTRSIQEAGEYSSGSPLQDARTWRRNAVRVRQLDQLARRVAELEKK